MLNEMVADEMYELGKPKWISVKDKLPEEKKRVLVYRKTKTFVRDIQILEWWLTDEDTYTHWMPLPEPPKDNS